MTEQICGKCKYYKATKNKTIGTCNAPLPYYASLDYKDWYVSYNDTAAKLCALYDPMWQELHEGCVVYE